MSVETRFKKQTLTQWPENLKDTIDWFLQVGGKDSVTNGHDKNSELQKAVEALHGSHVVTKSISNGDLRGLFNKVTEALQIFIGYDPGGSRKPTGKGIGSNDSSPYTSSYLSSATWEENSNASQTYALIFLGTTPLLYLCLSYTYWRCSSPYGKGDWIGQYIQDNDQPLGKFMNFMGFGRTDELDTKSARTVAQLLGDKHNSFGDFKKLTKSDSYSAFLSQLEEEASRGAMNCALTSCYILALAYFSSQPNEKHIPQVIQEIKNEFDNCSQRSEMIYHSWSIYGYSIPGDYKTLATLIKNFLQQVSSFSPEQPQKATYAAEAVGAAANATATSGANPNSAVTSGMAASGDISGSGNTSQSLPSPVAPLAGTLTTLTAAGGGAAAAYILNLGGTKTLVNGLLRIG